LLVHAYLERGGDIVHISTSEGIQHRESLLERFGHGRHGWVAHRHTSKVKDSALFVEVPTSFVYSGGFSKLPLS